MVPQAKAPSILRRAPREVRAAIAAEQTCNGTPFPRRASPVPLVDAFLFHSELDVLEARLHELAEEVQAFVLVEVPPRGARGRRPGVDVKLSACPGVASGDSWTRATKLGMKHRGGGWSPPCQPVPLCSSPK